MSISPDEFKNTVTVSDGAWGTELDKVGCPAGYCREEWNLSQPDVVRKVATAYVQAGARIILTNTFGANRITLRKHQQDAQARQINRAGARISKDAAAGRALVFGSIGPSGKMVLT
ncbi:MAG: homocysteine S-methyltransferase family protein, partial [Planctomycetes bacterium]|nr:homocysteine S-methyltransferase family protein [Planctomycetota bacterium]